jgi:hypothetical protein
MPAAINGLGFDDVLNTVAGYAPITTASILLSTIFFSVKDL